MIVISIIYVLTTGCHHVKLTPIDPMNPPESWEPIRGKDSHWTGKWATNRPILVRDAGNIFASY